MIHWQTIANQIVNQQNKVFSPIELDEKISCLFDSSQDISKRRIGHTVKGKDIFCYSFGSGKHNVLWYGFPDPGEALGGTNIYLLLDHLISNPDMFNFWDITWHFVPITNYDDQPNDGTLLSKVKKTNYQEIDWLVHKPRPETLALLHLAKSLKPVFTFPLHDEYHSTDLDLPVYWPVSKELSASTCQQLRQAVLDSNLSVSLELHHPRMGAGFFQMSDTSDFKNSTFSEFAKYGLCFICEIPDSAKVQIPVLLESQLTCGLIAMNEVLESRIPKSPQLF